MWDKEHSLTGNEFLDYLSWCEAQGVDIDGNPIDVEEDEEQQYTDDNIKQDLSEEAQYRRLKMKGRDKYE